MNVAELRVKCKQLLARRETDTTAWFYVKRDWRRQLAFAIGYVTLAAAMWSLNWRQAAIAFFAFYCGRVFRDIRWWHALANEWPTTAEVIDWTKVEAIANESTT